MDVGILKSLTACCLITLFIKIDRNSRERLTLIPHLKNKLIQSLLISGIRCNP